MVPKTINGLITKAEQGVLNAAAAILMKSDRHDDYFFDRVAKEHNKVANRISGENVIYFGSDYALVKVTENAKRINVAISEVKNEEVPFTSRH